LAFLPEPVVLVVDFELRDRFEEGCFPPFLEGLFMPLNLVFLLDVLLGGMINRFIVAKLMPGVYGLLFSVRGNQIKYILKL
jgi:hypothetical protein